MGSAIRMIKRMFTELRFDQLNAQMFKCIGLTSVDYIILLAGCIVVLIISILKERGVQIRAAVAAKPIAVRWLIYYGIIVAYLFWDTQVTLEADSYMRISNSHN